MDAAGMSYDEYLACYRDDPTETLATAAPRAHLDPVARTWEVSMVRLREESPAAADLLNLCAFLAADDIPRGILAKGVARLPEPLASALGNPSATARATSALRRYSLMAVEPDALSVHRLVQQVVRDGMSDDECQVWWGCAAYLLAIAMPQDLLTNPAVWSTVGRLLPHIRAVIRAEMEAGSAADAVGHILDHAGIYLQIRAQFAEAAEMLRQAVQVGEEALGPDHPDVATRVNNLGRVLQDQGDLAGAKACGERALRITEDTHGPDHPTVAIRVSNLGGVHEGQGDLASAKACYERALCIDEDTYGPDHPTVATAVNNLGNVLAAQGDLAGAKECLERALRIFVDTYGPDHPHVAYGANNLGSVLFRQGDTSAALECARRALRIRTKFLGVDHPDTVRSQRDVDAALAGIRA